MSTKNKILETEQKFYCGAPDKMLEILKQENFQEVSPEDETDLYFSDLDGDFIRNRTCLRIRQKGNKAELTHKGKSHSFSGPFSKVERNLEIPVEMIPEYNDILNSLGFFRYVSVVKKRRNFLKQSGPFCLTVSFDNLLNVGNFVELEVSGETSLLEVNENSAKKELDKLTDLFKNCRFEPADSPYRDYAASWQAKNFLKKDRTKTILFDFDGTIIPTEKPFFESFREAIEKRSGFKLDIEDYLNFEMVKSDNLLLELKNRGIDLGDEKDLIEEVYRLYENKLDNLLVDQKIADGFGSIMAFKKDGYKIALVSASKRKFVEKILAGFSGSDLFSVIIAREDVASSKPDPEAYLSALEKLGVEKDECLAIEDSGRGLEAAKSAGINCVLVSDNTLFGRENLDGLGAPVFENITEIYLLLKNA
ncbi:MAG: class IV adenylate cyclase [Candidatus Pacebacteria bacterium]|nr:class IV adenylate cyclase [Candidatus Paceibacterota bacterium]